MNSREIRDLRAIERRIKALQEDLQLTEGRGRDIHERDAFRRVLTHVEMVRADIRELLTDAISSVDGWSHS